jgi:hypothetical protein
VIKALGGGVHFLEMRWLGVLLVLAFLVAGCEDPQRILIAEARPPSPSTWPTYPSFSQRSCWTRSVDRTRVTRSAPSFVSVRSGKPTPPSEIVSRLLARFGDRRFVRAIRVGELPPRKQTKGVFPGRRRPPGDALWAYLTVVAGEGRRAAALAQWETELVEGALRDDFCSAGGRPLVGASVGDVLDDAADGGFALGQRFPNPSPEAFRARIAAVGKKYGFRMTSLRLLRPRELAPLLVVETERDRKAFVHDVPEIMLLLSPASDGAGQRAETFEGFFFEARDAEGPFVRITRAYRGQIMGGQWSWDRCTYPYLRTHSVGEEPCPSS